jgi:hypothetical protein
VLSGSQYLQEHVAGLGQRPGHVPLVVRHDSLGHRSDQAAAAQGVD